MSITENYREIRKEIPKHVLIVVASKTRTPEEIAEVIEAGAADIGENYVQEAEEMKEKFIADNYGDINSGIPSCPTSQQCDQYRRCLSKDTIESVPEEILIQLR